MSTTHPSPPGPGWSPSLSSCPLLSVSGPSLGSGNLTEAAQDTGGATRASEAPGSSQGAELQEGAISHEAKQSSHSDSSHVSVAQAEEASQEDPAELPCCPDAQPAYKGCQGRRCQTSPPPPQHQPASATMCHTSCSSGCQPACCLPSPCQATCCVPVSCRPTVCVPVRCQVACCAPVSCRPIVCVAPSCQSSGCLPVSCRPSVCVAPCCQSSGCCQPPCPTLLCRPVSCSTPACC
nr:keratin-associated protein 10-8-like [Ictidomys tridecemlineatus]